MVRATIPPTPKPWIPMPKRADLPTDDPSLGSVDPAQNPPVALPDADWAWFVARCEALGVADASTKRTAIEALYGHLVGVNRWLNLTTITAPREYLKLHVLDSLALVGDSRLKHLAEGAPCLDLGAGGGYPGLPLALWHPRIPWVLADARRKKAEFLNAAGSIVQRLGSSVSCTGKHLRGSEVARSAPALHRRCQLVVSRAMAQCDEVLDEAAALLQPHGHCVVFKGPAFAGEERERTMGACARLGYRFVSERRVVLEDGDPERVMVIFERV
jgi:16S rRNA (guanine527-N7)-methyltransferase